ncbi:unnamed protein product [Oppiella nova]|uniref:Uncharacterized protein n=1 Tax=Oppiella nova TaxID=334625 RepID=A0A7R9LIU3_9ACAR|nr:unnamed protein product [Oppiella nova]CAG2163963.1 unnamed protein product [Oppiella nova]
MSVKPMVKPIDWQQYNRDKSLKKISPYLKAKPKKWLAFCQMRYECFLVVCMCVVTVTASESESDYNMITKNMVMIAIEFSAHKRSIDDIRGKGRSESSSRRRVVCVEYLGLTPIMFPNMSGNRKQKVVNALVGTRQAARTLVRNPPPPLSWLSSLRAVWTLAKILI